MSLKFKEVRVVADGCDHYEHGIEPIPGKIELDGIYRCKRCKAVCLNYWALHDDIMKRG
jgi:hypothetical protein